MSPAVCTEYEPVCAFTPWINEFPIRLLQILRMHKGKWDALQAGHTSSVSPTQKQNGPRTLGPTISSPTAYPQTTAREHSFHSIRSKFLNELHKVHCEYLCFHTRIHTHSLFAVICTSVCVVSVPSWAPVTLGFLTVLLMIACILCVCRKFIFKKKEKGGKEKSEKNNINMSDVKDEGTKQVQTDCKV